MRRMEPCHKNDRVGGRNVCRAMDYSNGKEILAWIEDDRLAVPKIGRASCRERVS